MAVNRVDFAVAILGLGLIGGSAALRLQQQGTPVIGWDQDPQVRLAARVAGIPVAETIADAVSRGPRLVLLATPLRAVREVAGVLGAELRSQFPAEVANKILVSDVGSVKVSVHRDVAAAGLGDQFVGLHPMAGSERSGFSAASADLLCGASWALTLGERTTAEQFDLALRFAVHGFGARVYVTTPAEHDAAVALCSQVPHVLAAALARGAAGSQLARGLAAGSFRDGTRVAGGDPARNAAMVELNAPSVAAQLREIAADLIAVAGQLESDQPALTEFFRDAHRGLPAQVAGTAGVGQEIETETLKLTDSGQIFTQALKIGRRGGYVLTYNGDDVGIAYHR